MLLKTIAPALKFYFPEIYSYTIFFNLLVSTSYSSCLASYPSLIVRIQHRGIFMNRVYQSDKDIIVSIRYSVGDITKLKKCQKKIIGNRRF